MLVRWSDGRRHRVGGSNSRRATLYNSTVRLRGPDSKGDVLTVTWLDLGFPCALFVYVRVHKRIIIIGVV